MDKTKSVAYDFRLARLTPLGENETVEAEEVQDIRKQKVESDTATSEGLPPIALNGNGTKPTSLWETVMATPTVGISSETAYEPMVEELANVRQKLWEVDKEKEELKKFYEHWLSNQYDLEALTTSNEDAMAILSRFANSEALPVTALVEDNESELWVALLRLVQASLISYLGSYMRITPRGKQILDAVLNHEAAGKLG
jgi:hypothetical protein